MTQHMFWLEHLRKCTTTNSVNYWTSEVVINNVLYLIHQCFNNTRSLIILNEWTLSILPYWSNRYHLIQISQWSVWFKSKQVIKSIKLRKYIHVLVPIKDKTVGVLRLQCSLLYKSYCQTVTYKSKFLAFCGWQKHLVARNAIIFNCNTTMWIKEMWGLLDSNLTMQLHQK